MEGSEQSSSLITTLVEKGFPSGRLPSTAAPSSCLLGAHTGTSEGKGTRERRVSAGNLPTLSPRLLQELPATK